MLKLQYFGHLMRRADSFEKTLMLGKIEGRRRRGQQRMRWLDGMRMIFRVTIVEKPKKEDFFEINDSQNNNFNRLVTR